MPPKSKSSQAALPPKKLQSSTEEQPLLVGVLSRLPKLGAVENRRSKDEMNLIEYPWAALWKHEGHETIICHEWDVPDPDGKGKMVRAVWNVEGSHKLGLPNAGDLRLYLVLMELTREQNFAQVVTFTRYDLLKRLGWPHNKQRYDSLRRSFQRLKSVTISAQNAFRDARTGLLTEVAFSIIDNVYIVKAPRGRKSTTSEEPPPSFFRWNDVIYNSLQQGYLATIDLDFALSLRSDVALSLYRLLSKKAHGNRSTFEMNLSEFYLRHLGLRPTPYPSKMKERLKNGHDELLDRGFLHQVLYAPMKTGRGEKIVYVFQRPRAVLLAGDQPSDSQAPVKAPESPVEARAKLEAIPMLPGHLEALAGDSTAIPLEVEEPPSLIERVTALGVALPAARLLVKGTPREALELQLDCLADRHPNDAAATLVSAVRGEWKPPATYLARKEAEASAQDARPSKKRRAEREHELAQAQRAAAEQSENKTLDARFEALPPCVRSEIDAEVARRLKFVVQHLNEGTARGGWQATRRQVMRERDAQGVLEESQAEAAAQSARVRLLLSNDSELDAQWDALPLPERERVDEQVRQRIGKVGMAHFHSDHPGWHGVRRTVLREMFQSKLILPSPVNDKPEA